MGWDAVDVKALEPGGPGGMIRFLRKALGARAFGFNYFTLPAHAVGREHDHADTNQEEVYVILDGSGVMRVDGDEVTLRRGVFVRVDPASTRVPVAGAEGLEFVTFGAPLEGRYAPPDWG